MTALFTGVTAHAMGPVRNVNQRCSPMDRWKYRMITSPIRMRTVETSLWSVMLTLHQDGPGFAASRECTEPGLLIQCILSALR